MGFKGVEFKSLTRREDARGWLVELYRDDELPEGFKPTMGYFSSTKPGVSRGPHEHVDQTDGFIFFDGEYELHLWENRAGEPERYEIFKVGRNNPVFVTVPPGVVHAYKNVGDSDAFVINVPDRLYAGWERKEPVDEIRHESDPNSRFKL
jgi:dTDP-4-dehydrorhamnose 3,5-epimerase